MNHFLFSAALDCVAAFSAALFFIFRKSSIERYFGYFWLCVSFWTFLVAYQFQMFRWMDPKWWGFWLHAGCISVPIVFYHFTLKLTGRELRPLHLKNLLAGYILLLVFLILIALSNMFTAEHINRDLYTYPKPSFLYPVYIVYFQYYGFMSTWLIFKLNGQISIEKRKWLYLFLAVHLLAYIGAMDNYLIMYDWLIFPIYPYGLYGVIAYAAVGSFALVRLLNK